MDFFFGSKKKPPSFKMDLDFCDYFGNKKKIRLITEEIRYSTLFTVKELKLGHLNNYHNNCPTTKQLGFTFK